MNERKKETKGGGGRGCFSSFKAIQALATIIKVIANNHLGNIVHVNTKVMTPLGI